MAKTVFILGAGASAQAGAPLLGNFLEVARDLWELEEVGDAKDHFKRVFDGITALQSVHTKAELDLGNIESIFSTFEMAKTLKTFPNRSEEQIDRLIISLKRVIVKTLELTTNFPITEGYIESPKPYPKFLELIKFLREKAKPKHSVAILTFNYDIALDLAVYNASYKIDYALEPHNKPNNALPVLKLHGSLNWTIEKDNDLLYAWNLKDFLRAHPVENARHFNKCTLPIASFLKYLNREEERYTAEPVIVPPSWNKADSHRLISPVWQRAAKELHDTENLFIIGFSLPPTDTFFQFLFSLGTEGGTLFKRFRVYDIDESPRVKDRFEQILGPAAKSKFEYQSHSFEQAIPIIKGQFSIER